MHALSRLTEGNKTGHNGEADGRGLTLYSSRMTETTFKKIAGDFFFEIEAKALPQSIN
jgi:hypothetical protein